MVLACTGSGAVVRGAEPFWDGEPLVDPIARAPVAGQGVLCREDCLSGAALRLSCSVLPVVRCCAGGDVPVIGSVERCSWWLRSRIAPGNFSVIHSLEFSISNFPLGTLISPHSFHASAVFSASVSLGRVIGTFFSPYTPLGFLCGLTLSLIPEVGSILRAWD